MEQDPDNRLLSYYNRRRLEAEALRDSILSVSGRLNPERHGLPIFPPLPDGIEERAIPIANGRPHTGQRLANAAFISINNGRSPCLFFRRSTAWSARTACPEERFQ